MVTLLIQLTPFAKVRIGDDCGHFTSVLTHLIAQHCAEIDLVDSSVIREVTEEFCSHNLPFLTEVKVTWPVPEESIQVEISLRNEDSPWKH